MKMYHIFILTGMFLALAGATVLNYFKLRKGELFGSLFRPKEYTIRMFEGEKKYTRLSFVLIIIGIALVLAGIFLQR